MHHHARIYWDRSLHATKQHEGAHRLAIGVGRKLSALVILTIHGKIDEPANGGGELQVPNLTSQSDGTEHRAPIGIDSKCRAGEFVTLRKDHEMSWRIRGDRAGGRDEDLTLAAARVCRPLHAEVEVHRRCAIRGRLRR